MDAFSHLSFDSSTINIVIAFINSDKFYTSYILLYEEQYFFQSPHFYGHFGVRFITICPGITDTGLVANPHKKTLFKFTEALAARLARAERQSPEVCAQNLVKLAETGKNGDVYLLDLGEIKEVTFPIMWAPVFKS